MKLMIFSFILMNASLTFAQGDGSQINYRATVIDCSSTDKKFSIKGYYSEYVPDKKFILSAPNQFDGNLQLFQLPYWNGNHNGTIRVFNKLEDKVLVIEGYADQTKEISSFTFSLFALPNSIKKVLDNHGIEKFTSFSASARVHLRASFQKSDEWYVDYKTTCKVFPTPGFMEAPNAPPF